MWIYIYKDIDDDSFPPSVASLWLPKVFQKTRGSFVRKKSMCIFNHMCVWLCITGIGPCCAVFFFTGVFAMKLRRSETLQNTCNKHRLGKTGTKHVQWGQQHIQNNSVEYITLAFQNQKRQHLLGSSNEKWSHQYAKNGKQCKQKMHGVDVHEAA